MTLHPAQYPCFAKEEEVETIFNYLMDSLLVVLLLAWCVYVDRLEQYALLCVCMQSAGEWLERLQ